MATMRTLLAALLIAVLSLWLAACSAQGEISDEGIQAEVEGEGGGDDG